jgi:hypothetical protein
LCAPFYLGSKDVKLGSELTKVRPRRVKWFDAAASKEDIKANSFAIIDGSALIQRLNFAPVLGFNHRRPSWTL